MRCDKLKPATRSKPRGLLSEGDVFLHDNVRPPTAAHTVERLQKFNFEVLTHPTLTFPNRLCFGPVEKRCLARSSAK
ncbi:Histone-lysine N-methyltransferase SETMAR [Biomphalaria glabrata]|nr:Histone-lysine N-methyltransferase SETMAR [Biomphalaria glabrata]